MCDLGSETVDLGCETVESRAIVAFEDFIGKLGASLLPCCINAVGNAPLSSGEAEFAVYTE